MSVTYTHKVKPGRSQYRTVSCDRYVDLVRAGKGGYEIVPDDAGEMATGHVSCNIRPYFDFELHGPYGGLTDDVASYEDMIAWVRGYVVHDLRQYLFLP